MSGAPGPRITVVGSANIDQVVRCERLPRPGETVTDAVIDRVPGGKGANQAVAAARLGARVRFVGRIGRDDLALQSLQREGVSADGVVRDDGESGVAVILVERSGENVIAVAPGANRRLTADDVSAGMREGAPDALICQQEIPGEAMRAAIAAVRPSNGVAATACLFCLNAAPARGPLDADLKPDLLVVNSYEYEVAGPYEGLVALTRGAEGAVLLEDGVEVARARPPQVDVVDGTAAGDAFVAALVVALLGGRTRKEALVRACAAGALAASRAGAQPSLPTADDVEAILAGDL